jgi:hypothetical protein
MTEQGPQGLPPTELADEARRLAGTVLVRIATEPDDETAVFRDLGHILGSKAGSDVWRIEVSRLVAALIAGGLVERDSSTLRATGQGIAAAVEFLGGRKGIPKDWRTARDIHLIASALELSAAPVSKQRLLGKADGLRALVVISHWRLEIKGAPSAARIRSALAARALDRAFGNQVGASLGPESELPAKAARLLAARLSTSGREFGTDGRLIAALAAEAVGSPRGDLKSLQRAILRKYLGRESESEKGRKTARRTNLRRRTQSLLSTDKRPRSGATSLNATGTGAQSASPADTATVAPAATADSTGRPDPAAFASAVHAATAETAEGWAGNRRAFISKVWAVIQERHAAWALTEIEFKCMLTEAHRTGLVVLANADLKDKKALKELQESAVVYKNTVWHYVRASD